MIKLNVVVLEMPERGKHHNGPFPGVAMANSSLAAISKAFGTKLEAYKKGGCL